MAKQGAGAGQAEVSAPADVWSAEYVSLIQEFNEISSWASNQASAAHKSYQDQKLAAHKNKEAIISSGRSIFSGFTSSIGPIVDRAIKLAYSDIGMDYSPPLESADSYLNPVYEKAADLKRWLDSIPPEEAVQCPDCGQASQPDMKFCLQCGKALSTRAGLVRQAKETVDSVVDGCKIIVKRLSVNWAARWGCLLTTVSVSFLLLLDAVLTALGVGEKSSTGGVVFGVLCTSLMLYPLMYWIAKIVLVHNMHGLGKKYAGSIGPLGETIEATASSLERQYEAITSSLERQYQERLRQIVQETQRRLQAWRNRQTAFLQRIQPWIPDWADPSWSTWQPVSEPLPFLRIGSVSRTMAIPEANLYEQVSLPALLPFRGAPGLLVLDGPAQGSVLQGLGIRLLAAVPPGKLRFTFIDPVGLGQGVATLINLKDFDVSEEDSLITFRVWTEPDHIRQQLMAIKDHIATVLQERLRDQYPDIETYNREAGEVAVPYRILMALDFPANFSDESAQHLLSIAQTGSRVGVYPIVWMDASRKLPYGFEAKSLASALTCVGPREKGRLTFMAFKGLEDWDFRFDEPPTQDLANQVIKRWGEKAGEGMRVEVPFGKMLEASKLGPKDWWQGDSRSCLEVPLGPVTARKIQHLELGKGTLNHAIIVGRTGSGKSNLMHVLITASALRYPPDELRLYLIDLKTVEFVVYRDLPHAEAVAVDADREFALSVLEGLDQEMRRRMEVFKSVVANDLAEYRDKTGEKMPRILLIVDEFQVLFERDDRVAQEAARILDRLVRQGRAFGIHVLLGSQSLAGSALPRATIDQMAVRVALQCSEADSRLVLAEDNPAARRLSRPGQAIYNSRNGLIEGNTEFQVALFSDEDRDTYVKKISQMAMARKWDRKPIVFEGNEPARLEACLPLLERLSTAPLASPRMVETWLGESVSIRPPVALRWARRSGNHLVVVTREEEEGVGVLMAVAVGLAVQYPKDRLQVYIADFSTPDAEWAQIPEILQDEFPRSIRILGRRDLLEELKKLWDALQQSIATGTPPREDRYLFLVGLHRIRDLRLEEGMGYGFGAEREQHPVEQLATLLRDGPEFGIHVAIWCDTMGNLRRSLERRVLGEIGFRVGGPMSEQDSTELLDQPEAARLDKPHRMVFYDDERPGVLEKFRPYVLRDLNWLRSIAQFLRSPRA